MPPATQQLGVRLIDTTILPARMHPELATTYVHACTGAGVVTALRSALTHHGSRPLPSPAYLSSLVTDVPNDARSALRLALASEVQASYVTSPSGGSGGATTTPSLRWRSGDALSPADVLLLGSLPIFEVHSRGAPTFTSLFGGMGSDVAGVCQLFLPPIGMPNEVIGEQFVRADTQQDIVFMTGLGVRTLSDAEFYQAHVLPTVDKMQGLASEVVTRKVPSRGS